MDACVFPLQQRVLGGWSWSHSGVWAPQLFEAGAKLLPPEPLPQADVLVKRCALGAAADAVPLGDAVGTGAPTLLTVSFKAYGRSQALEWQQCLYDAGLVPDDPSTNTPSGLMRTVDLNVMEGWVLRMVSRFLFSGLTQASPTWLRDNVLAFLPTHTEVCLCRDACLCGMVPKPGAIGRGVAGVLRGVGHPQPAAGVRVCAGRRGQHSLAVRLCCASLLLCVSFLLSLVATFVLVGSCRDVRLPRVCCCSAHGSPTAAEKENLVEVCTALARQ